MKKILNWAISVAGLLLLIGLLVLEINDVSHFLTIEAGSTLESFINYLRTYGAVTIVGALVLVNIIGKGIIRIILTVLFLIMIGFYIWTAAFPIEFAQLFGI